MTIKLLMKTQPYAISFITAVSESRSYVTHVQIKLKRKAFNVKYIVKMRVFKRKTVKFYLT